MRMPILFRGVLVGIVAIFIALFSSSSAYAADLDTKLQWQSQGEACEYNVIVKGAQEITSDNISMTFILLKDIGGAAGFFKDGKRYEWNLRAKCAGDGIFRETTTKGVFTFAPGKVVFENPLQSSSIGDLIGRILNLLFNVAIVLTPIMAIIAGFYFLTAAGEPAKVKKAQDVLLWTVVGFGVILLSKGLVAVLQGILGI